MSPGFRIIALLFSILTLSPFTLADQKNPLQTTQAHSTAHFISDASQIERGQPFRAGLKILLEEKWHTYWHNPGDSGAPVIFDWKLPEGWSASEIQMPAPQRIPTPPLETFGFEGESLFYATLTPPKNSTANSVDLELEAEWLVCKDICIPAVYSFKMNLPISGSFVQSESFEAFEIASKEIPGESNQIQGSYKVSGDEVQIQLVTPESWQIIDLFPGPDNILSNKPIAAQTATDFKPGQWQLVTEASLRKSKAKNTRVLVEYKTSTEQNSTNHAWVTLKKEASPLLAILGFAFLGGLILNLMPCVFPIISMKFFSVLKHSKENIQAVRRDNTFYILGVLVSFWALTLLLYFLRASGEALGWGFQLQSPAFVIGLLLLFALMAFNFLGWFEIQFLLPGTGKWLSKEGPTGHFFTGVLSTIVASPCTAPFMGVSIGFALAQNLPIMLLIFTSLGLGLSFPYILLSIFPSLTLFLPKPGPWMEKLKTFMAFPLFATMIWLAWSLSFQISSTSLAFVWCSVLLLGFWVWFSRNLFETSKTKLRTGQILILVMALWLAFANIQPAAQLQAGETSSGGLIWKPYSEEMLSKLKSEGKAVFIDFTAAWCITCQVNKQVTFTNSEIIELIKAEDIQLLRADWTNRDPDITRVLEKFNRAGVPLYLFYPAHRDKAEVLPEILTATIFKEHVQPFLNSTNQQRTEK